MKNGMKFNFLTVHIFAQQHNLIDCMQVSHMEIDVVTFLNLNCKLNLRLCERKSESFKLLLIWIVTFALLKRTDPVATAFFSFGKWILIFNLVHISEWILFWEINVTQIRNSIVESINWSLLICVFFYWNRNFMIRWL